MFLGCLYLGPLLFSLLLKAEMVRCFLFNHFPLTLQSFLFSFTCLQRSTAFYRAFEFQYFFYEKHTDTHKINFLRTALDKSNISVISLTRTAGPQQLLNSLRVSLVLLLRISWPFCFGKYSHRFFLFCSFPSNSAFNLFVTFFMFTILAVIY